ncbi:hypothetical protein SAMN04489724_0251 [Algoriphagus locisalis]|uniref:Lipoprotein n=1 Tax=Algoriphagus locisalis TaxID=305507 RepID=A0A1I7E883_9BACT|nr:hypothetical protein [Algoriphagus locisalis]SFU20144.1 hypothetical protein SAMN04489724_0251 [Algoriphagus locisalis]
MKTNLINRILLLTGVSLLAFACGGSSEDQALEKVAEDLGIDKKELENKSFYSFEITGGTLDGQTFTTPVYAQGGIDSRWNENTEISASTIGFVDPPQGNSTFRMIWEGDKISPLKPEENPFGENSFIELKVEKDDQKYTFLSDGGSYQVVSKNKKAWVDQITKKEYPIVDIEAEFEGDFTETNSGEKVKIKGWVKGFDPR